MENIYYLNGEYVPESEAKISVRDRGVRHGDAVFDTERTFNGEVFKLREHLERFYRSLHFTRIDPGLTIDELEKITLEVVRRNESIRPPNGDYWVTQLVTRGMSSDVMEPGPATVCVKCYPITFEGYADLYDTGAHVVFPITRRDSPESLDPKVKHISRLNLVMADIEAKQVDPRAQAVMLDLDGNIAETVGGNIFVVTDGVVRYPSSRNLLEGVSRKMIIEMAKNLGIPTEEDILQPYDAYTADEVFLTTTSFCVMPVSKINGNPMRGEIPGPIVKQLLASWSELVGLDIVQQAQSNLHG